MKKGKRYKKTSLKRKITISLLVIILIIAVIFIVGYKYLLSDLTINTISDNIQELGISEEIENKYKNEPIINIALFGLDGRNQHADEGRSDSLMIVSVNKESGKIKLSSILRDSYVKIEGYSNQKINHAYSYGGPLLAIKTLNQNFKLNIKDYISVNFNQFVNVVDTLGGIDVNISKREMEEINNQVTGQRLSQDGQVHLNGEQTLAYSRIRKIDSDNVRADRQKQVIQAIIQKTCNNKSNYISLVKTILPSVETSLQYHDILEYIAQFYNKDISVEETTIPGDKENAQGGIYEGAWVWRYDLDSAAERLHNFIYN